MKKYFLCLIASAVIFTGCTVHLTPEEREDIMEKACDALEHDDIEEYNRLCKMLPIDPAMANMFKRFVGIDKVIASGMNVIKAVEEYGEDWLRD